MSARRLSAIVLALIGSAILIGCGAEAAKRSSAAQGFTSGANAVEQPDSGASAFSIDLWNNAPEAKAAIDSSANPNSLPPLPTAAAPAAAQASLPENPAGQVPLIIKQGSVRLQVKDTDQAIDRLTQIVSDSHGYIISNRVWFEQIDQESCKYATYTIGVPVDAFETALRRLRSLAEKVVDETASGQDVSEEYTDLESRLGNLIATRDRIRSFLAQAQSVEESLRINQELATIEDQIEQVEGRMRYLSSRAAYSTITVQLDPKLPDKPTPTPTPTPVPPAWDPGKTFERASNITIRFGQFLVDLVIYLAVWIPFAIPVLIVWFIYKIVAARRKPNQP